MIEAIAHLGLLEDEAIELDSAALELAALDHPGTDLEPFLEELAGIAEEAAEEGQWAASARGRAVVLSSVLAESHGFEGDRDSYDDPANADLIQVMERRQGLPVSLSILYVATARRIGWEADALNTPGHVLVRLGPDPAPVLIDPFNRGEIVVTDQLSRLLAHATGGGAITAAHLQPMSNRDVLVRLLTNQATRAGQAGNATRALTLYERITTVAPAHGFGWWERARLELSARNVAAARASLSAMLEMTRDPALRTHVSAALDALAGPAT
jgi:regulator of sirC expression with transglutaminase-like and TPR domain